MPAKRYPALSKCPHFLHGGDYNPDQWIKWKDEIWKEDMRLAKLAGINTLSIGIFSWTALESEDGVYDFTWMDEVMDMLAANDMYAVLATPSGARPAWMSQKYPEVLRVNQDRTKNLHGGRHNHCMTSPAYKMKTTQMNTRLANRYKDHPALAIWHISNELHGECHCELCQDKFREWLKSKYKTLDALNQAWWTSFWAHTYTDWSQLESPSSIGETSVHCHVIDWKRFNTDQLVEFYKNEIIPLREITPDIPITTNLMGLFPGVNYFELGKHLDVVSWDSYPQWRGTLDDYEIACQAGFAHDLMRGTGNQKPFMLMESSPSATNWRPVAKLHRPNGHHLYSLQAVAHGADTIQYFQYRKSRGSSEKFHGAVIDHEGTENTRVFNDVAQVGTSLKKLDDIVGCGVDAKVAIVFDWENRWALEDSKGMLQDKNKYEETIIRHYAEFWSKGIPVDIVDQTSDISGYTMLIAPMSYMLRGDFADRVNKYIADGGTFITTYVSGYVDESDLCFLGGFPGPLRKALGIWCEEIDSLYPDDRNSLSYNGKNYEVFDFCEMIHPEGNTKTLGTYGNDFYAGNAALTVNEYGRGKAYYIAARTEKDFLTDFYSRLCDDLKITSCVSYDLPIGVNAMSRSDAETDFIFLMNFSNDQVTIDIGEGGYSLLTNEDINGQIMLDARGIVIYSRGR